MTPAFVRNLMSRASELYDVRLPETDRKRYAAEPEPMTDFGGFDRRTAPALTAEEIVTAIRKLPLTVQNLKAVIGAAESKAHALWHSANWTPAMCEVCEHLTDANARVDAVYVEVPGAEYARDRE